MDRKKIKKYVKCMCPCATRIYRDFRVGINKIYNYIDSPIVILLYHRVANLDSDPQQLAVSVENFDKHISFLKNNYPILSFDKDWEEIKEPSVIITFDDGYFDNYKNAFPILCKYEVPATIFVTTGRLNTTSEPWCDDIERIILLNNKLIGKEITFDFNFLGKKRMYIKNKDDLRIMYHIFHDTLLEMSSTHRDSVIRDFISKYGGAPIREEHRYLNNIELKKMSESPIITIGGHTVTHTRLSNQDRYTQKKEIIESKKCLEKIIGKEVTTFSYPFGGKKDYNEDTIDILEQCGMKKVASNFPGQVHKKTSYLELPRHLVRNWNLDEFKNNLERFWYL